jgi:hypothetical protein
VVLFASEEALTSSRALSRDEVGEAGLGELKRKDDVFCCGVDEQLAVVPPLDEGPLFSLSSEEQDWGRCALVAVEYTTDAPMGENIGEEKPPRPPLLFPLPHLPPSSRLLPFPAHDCGPLSAWLMLRISIMLSSSCESEAEANRGVKR